MNARKKQEARFEGSPTHTNSGIQGQELETHAQPSEASKKLLENAMSRMGLSARAYDRILKVERTIADLEGEEAIELPMLRRRFNTATWIALPEKLQNFLNQSNANPSG
ncbi:MAG: hypothetical protein Ct9H90mP9_3880 [Pseudomonadota bacterium]|nr:MAG: hypothetical protein Ct9H90mP9_3880 [Pseudomonadota bacterium]